MISFNEIQCGKFQSNILHIPSLLFVISKLSNQFWSWFNAAHVSENLYSKGQSWWMLFGWRHLQKVVSYLKKVITLITMLNSVYICSITDTSLNEYTFNEGDNQIKHFHFEYSIWHFGSNITGKITLFLMKLNYVGRFNSYTFKHANNLLTE